MVAATLIVTLSTGPSAAVGPGKSCHWAPAVLLILWWDQHRTPSIVTATARVAAELFLLQHVEL